MTAGGQKRRPHKPVGPSRVRPLAVNLRRFTARAAALGDGDQPHLPLALSIINGHVMFLVQGQPAKSVGLLSAPEALSFVPARASIRVFHA